MSVRELVSVDGRISRTTDAVVPLRDDGLYRGDGAFEVLRLYGGRPYALADHLDRLERSAAAIELDFDRTALAAEIEALLEELGPADGLLRLVVTRGKRRIAAIEPLPQYPPVLRLASVTYAPSVILNGVKSLSYAANMQATRLAQARHADEAVLVTPDGTVLEAPTSSIFWTSPEGVLRTTALAAGILDSITRGRLLERLEVEEGTWPLADLMSAGEAFLASTTREVHPVASVDGSEYPTAPGPRTRDAIEAFAAALEQELATHPEATS